MTKDKAIGQLAYEELRRAAKLLVEARQAGSKREGRSAWARPNVCSVGAWKRLHSKTPFWELRTGNNDEHFTSLVVRGATGG